MRCLADFVLDSDMRFPDGAGAFALKAPNGEFELTLSNIADHHELPESVLSAQLVFDVDSFDEIREEAGSKLAVALNCLAFATNRKFAFHSLKRVIDWTPGIVERQAIIYVETPEWDIAEPALSSGFLETAERLMAMQSGEEQQTAMRWYRLGVQAENLEEQFSYFWFALEIASEALKGSERIPSKCPKCKAALRCESCNEVPLHRRYPGEAIQQMVERVHPNNAGEVFRTLQLIRHTLMHGGRIDSIADQLPCTDEQAVNKLAFVTWQAIGHMFKPDPHDDRVMNLGYVENIARRTLIAGFHVTTTLLRGDPRNPQLADFPDIKAEVVRAASRGSAAGSSS